MSLNTPPPEINPPRFPEDRRPNDRPFYIEECCPNCGSILVYEELAEGETDWDSILFDEFVCPKCNDGCYLDWPPQQIQKLNQAIEECQAGKGIPFTEEMWAEMEALLEGVEVDDG